MTDRDVETRGCFVEHNHAQYITLVRAGHETMRSAPLLAAAARGQKRCKAALGDKPACTIQD